MFHFNFVIPYETQLGHRWTLKIFFPVVEGLTARHSVIFNKAEINRYFPCIYLVECFWLVNRSQVKNIITFVYSLRLQDMEQHKTRKYIVCQLAGDF